MRALAWCLAAALALAGCKSEDKPKPEAAKPPPTEMKETAAETAEQAKEKAEAAADKAKAALEAARGKMQAAGEVAVDKLTDTKALREALGVMNDRMKQGIEDMKNAPSDEARQAAGAALQKLVEEKQKLEERLTALSKDEERKQAKDAKAP